jgi:hypothetical protein
MKFFILVLFAVCSFNSLTYAYTNDGLPLLIGVAGGIGPFIEIKKDISNGRVLEIQNGLSGITIMYPNVDIEIVGSEDNVTLNVRRSSVFEVNTSEVVVTIKCSNINKEKNMASNVYRHNSATISASIIPVSESGISGAFDYGDCYINNELFKK